ncbi:hypothetical protein ES705_38772 [subsurface metagenome]
MKKLILLFAFAIIAISANCQTYHIIDTIHPGIVGTDTFYHFPGYTDRILGILIDCRTMDDTLNVSFNVGVGWAMFDTTFIQLDSDNLPASVSVLNDYLVGFEKIGMAFSYPKILFDRAASDSTKRYPIQITYDGR